MKWKAERGDSMTPKEIEVRTPDNVMQATDGRRIEMYGQPSTNLLAKAVCRVIVKKMLEDARKKETT